MLEMFLIAAFWAMAERDGAGMVGGSMLLGEYDAVCRGAITVVVSNARKEARRVVFQLRANNKQRVWKVVDKAAD